MSGDALDAGTVGTKRKRTTRETVADDAAHDTFSSPSGADAGTESALLASVSPSSMSSRGGSNRRKRLSPQLELEPESIEGADGDDGLEDDGDSPGSSPGKKRQSLAGGKWTKYEDECLRAGVEEIGAKNWKAISVRFLKGKRTDVQCLHRWQKVLRPGLVKGPWTKEEDDKIVECIRSGVTKWSEIAATIPGRIGKQCRERWYNHLDPNIKKTGWTEEEDLKLQQAVALVGTRWIEVSKMLVGRSENACKNRWNSAARRKANAATRNGGSHADGTASEGNSPNQPGTGGSDAYFNAHSGDEDGEVGDGVTVPGVTTLTPGYSSPDGGYDGGSVKTASGRASRAARGTSSTQQQQRRKPTRRNTKQKATPVDDDDGYVAVGSMMTLDSIPAPLGTPTPSTQPNDTNSTGIDSDKIDITVANHAVDGVVTAGNSMLGDDDDGDGDSEIHDFIPSGELSGMDEDEDGDGYGKQIVVQSMRSIRASTSGRGGALGSSNRRATIGPSPLGKRALFNKPPLPTRTAFKAGLLHVTMPGESPIATTTTTTTTVTMTVPNAHLVPPAALKAIMNQRTTVMRQEPQYNSPSFPASPVASLLTLAESSSPEGTDPLQLPSRARTDSTVSEGDAPKREVTVGVTNDVDATGVTEALQSPPGLAPKQLDFTSTVLSSAANTTVTRCEDEVVVADQNNNNSINSDPDVAVDTNKQHPPEKDETNVLNASVVGGCGGGDATVNVIEAVSPSHTLGIVV